jgi:hypothetical protein
MKTEHKIPSVFVRSVCGKKMPLNFAHYLKIKEYRWVIYLVNKRSRQAEADRKSGKKCVILRGLQKEYRNSFY